MPVRLLAPLLLLSLLLPGSINAAPPNVVLILIDDMGWPDPACYGHAFHETPAIDRLAGEGMRLTDFYAAGAVCSPTRASIQSGQYQARLGLTAHIPGHWRPFEQLIEPANAPHLPLEIPTIAEALGEAGYATGYFGKWHLGGVTHNPDKQGYDVSLVTGGRHFAPRFRTTPPHDVPPGTPLTEFLTDQTLAFVEANRGGPFFAMLSHYAVHIPLEATPEEIERFASKPRPDDRVNNPTYAAMVAAVDRSVDRISARLAELGLAENTLVIFTSDNGGLVSRYDGGVEVSTNAPLRDEKGTLYEGGIRVPMIARWPGVIPEATTSDTPATTVDLYPTLLAAAGAKPAAGHLLDGASLLPVLKGSGSLKREAIFWHYPHYHHSRPAGAIRAGDWKLIEFFDNGKLELYNLRDDIGERRNLAAERTDKARSLQSQLAAWRKKVGAQMPRPNPKHDPLRAGQWWSRRSGKPLPSQRAPEPGFARLFNGATLDGWEGDPELWSVEQHAITGVTTDEKPLAHNSFLIWRGGQVGDFELRLDYRVSDTGRGNSGIQYRSRELPEVGKWAVGGYQADIDRTKKFSGILYEEKGRGILARRGERVELAAAPPTAKGKGPRVTRQVTGQTGDADALAGHIKTGEWNRYTIVARGHRLIHKINGHVMVDVTDNDEAHRAARGLLALQLHVGPAMRVQFKNVRLKRLGEEKRPAAAGARKSPASPPRSKEKADIAAAWSFDTDAGSWKAAAGCEAKVADGALTVRSTDDDPQLVTQVAAPAGSKRFTVRSRHKGRYEAELYWVTAEEPGFNEARSVKFEMRGGGDWKTFRCYFDAAADVTQLRFDPHAKKCKLEIDSIELANAAPPPPAATPAEQIQLLPGFRAELLYAVPGNSEGSWVSLAVDPRGRLTASDQYGGLYRITPPPPGEPASRTRVEKLDVEMGMAHGLLYAFGSLYCVVNSKDDLASGLYRLRDTDGDDQFDEVRLLRKIEGKGEHGPHGIVLSPDGGSLYLAGGNNTELPELAASRVPRNWQEDLLLPRMWDARGHAAGRLAPGGWICRLDPDGKNFELVSSGYRNEYDLAFSPEGELFTYDADMEWDVGTPWYRPTRVNHVTSGSEFGWRSGTGKWPAYYADSLPAVVDIGPGSPTGVVFGSGTKFPAKYQRALFISDWSYGVLYAVHLEPHGASYRGEAERFATAAPLPVTDMVVRPQDGALYFTIGGRRTQSGLYRVTYVGDEPTGAAPPQVDDGEALRAVRRELETLHAPGETDAVARTWPHLGHSDRHIRFAARIALEHRPVAEWQQRALAEPNPAARITALIGLARNGDKALAGPIVRSLVELDPTALDETRQLAWLRAVALTFARMGPPDDAIGALAVAKVAPLYPAASVRLNRELSRILVYLEAPDVAAKTLDLMERAVTQEEQLHYALVLRNLQNGWTLDQRKAYFAWFVEAAGQRGGMSFGGFLNNIRKEAIATLSAEEREALEDLITAELAPREVVAAAPRPFVKKWSVAELLPAVESNRRQPDLVRGRAMFAAAACYKCHRFRGEGGISGPDLTAVGGRFTPRNLLESIVEPSKVVSDQYQATQFLTADGKALSGRIVNLSGDSLKVLTDLLDPSKITSLDREEIEEMRPATVSMMPSGLVDTLSQEEILDLVAYLRAGIAPPAAAKP